MAVSEQPDTPPGTVLQVGDTWRQGGLELSLVDSSLVDAFDQYPAGVAVSLQLTNRRGVDLPLRDTQDDFSATDSSGNRLRVYDGQGGAPSFDETFIIHADETVGLPHPGNSGEGLFIAVDVFDTSITSISITVTAIGSIVNASWQIPIPH
jgi:hypothetical protein